MKAKRASATALLILRVAIFASFDKRYARLINPQATKINKTIAKTVTPLYPLFIFLVSNQITHALFNRLEQWLNPGFVFHIAVRKQFIFQAAQQAIAHNATQLIIIGAGYDSLGFQLTQNYPHLTCFEIDHPDTSRLKQQALAPLTLPGSLQLIEADLRVNSLTEVIKNQPLFVSQKTTLVILEGLLMYLDKQAVDQLFAQLLKLLPAVSCLFSFMNVQDDGRIGFRLAHPLIKQWLDYHKEPFLWGTSTENLRVQMGNYGFDEVRVWSGQELLTNAPGKESPCCYLAEGESLAWVTKH